LKSVSRFANRARSESISALLSRGVESLLNDSQGGSAVAPDDAEYDELKGKITAYLGSLEGKGVDTTVNIAKAIGVKRKECSKILNRMELEGLVEPGGVMAGVAGYKLKA
jgi:hypothetical protein